MEVTVKRVARLAVQGDYAQIRQLATEPVVTGRIGTGQTALMLAAEAVSPPWQYAKCIEYFLHLGADPDASDPNGDTAAHVAARRDNLRLMALLPFESKFQRNESGLTPLMEAVKAGSARCCQHLLHLFRQQSRWERRDQLLGMLNYEEHTALDMAQEMGQSDIAALIDVEQQLVIHESNVLGLGNALQDDCNELKRLCLAGDFAGLQSLLGRVNCDLPDVAGTTALMWAVRTDIGGGSVRDDGVRLLAEFADPTAVDVRGRGCLHWAARAGNAAGAAALVVAGASVNCRDEELRTPLMLAGMSGVGEGTLRALLLAGADWSLRDRRGRTAVQLAAECNIGAAVQLLRGYESKAFFDEQIESRWRSCLVPGRTASSTSAETDGADARDEFYPVTDPQGLCLIINVLHYEAQTELDDREGSGQDVRRVRELFERLGFIVEERLDCSAQEMGEFLDEKSECAELAGHGCFVCFLMAHGTSEFVFGCDGQMFNIRELVEPFQMRRPEGQAEAVLRAGQQREHPRAGVPNGRQAGATGRRLVGHSGLPRGPLGEPPGPNPCAEPVRHTRAPLSEQRPGGHATDASQDPAGTGIAPTVERHVRCGLRGAPDSQVPDQEGLPGPEGAPVVRQGTAATAAADGSDRHQQLDVQSHDQLASRQ